MRLVGEYRRLAKKYRRLATTLTKPADKRASELMAQGWEKAADKREAKLRSSGNLQTLMKYFLAATGGAAIGGATAIMLLFHFANHDVLAMAAEYAGDKPELIKFMSDMGYPKIGEWCGEFAASVIKRAGGTPPSGAAIASNWRRYGTPDAMPHLGDVAVADRGVPTGATGSHVGFVTGVDLKNGTFTLESGNSCNVYTTRKITGFSFHTPPDNVVSALTGNGGSSAIGKALACHSVAPSITVYPFVPAIPSPNPDDCSQGSLDADRYDEIQNGPQEAAWSRGRTLRGETGHMQGLPVVCEVKTRWAFPAAQIE